MTVEDIVDEVVEFFGGEVVVAGEDAIMRFLPADPFRR